MADAAPPTGEPTSQRRSPAVAGRVLVAALAVLTLLTVGLEWQIKSRAEQGLLDRHVEALVPATTNPTTTTGGTGSALASVLTTLATPTAAATTSTANGTPTRAATYRAENILLLGSDTRSGGNAAVGADTSTAGVANSDVVMIAHVSADRQHVTVLSIPRDTMIPAPTSCRMWDSATGVVSTQVYAPGPGERFHFNSGYSVGGPQCTVTEVQNLTGLHIDRFIGIDFVGFQSMVDALGGITVDICSPVVDTVLGTVVPRAGEQKILGAQALNLVRARDVIGDNLSDLARIRRQQIVLSAILRQVTTAGTLLNPAKLNSFLQAFVKNTVTDNVTIDDLVMLAGSLGSLDPGVVTFYTLPTTPSTITPGALEVAQPAAGGLFAAMQQDRPPATRAAPSTSRTKARPSNTALPPTLTSGPVAQFSLAFPTTKPTGTAAATTVQSVNAATAQCAGPGNE